MPIQKNVVRFVLFGKNMVVNTKTGKGLDALYKLLSPKINCMAQKVYLNGMDQQDKVQMLQIHVWRLLPKWNFSRSTMITFLTRCLDNHIRNQIKRNNLRSNVELFSPLTKQMENSSSYASQDPLDILEDIENDKLTQKEIEKEAREAFVLTKEYEE